MLNNISTYSVNSTIPHQSFGKDDKKKSAQIPMQQNAADEFISGIEKIEKNRQNGNFFSKYLWSTTAALVSMTPLVGYELYNFFKTKQAKKNNNFVKVKKLNKSFKRNFPLVFAGSMALLAGLQHYFNSQNDKNYQKVKQEFKALNTETSAKLDGTFKSGYVGAFCSESQNIQINRNIMNDPIARKSLKKLIKHELVHARQFEMIARSNDGIKKLNYANIIKTIENIKNDPNTINDFKKIQNDIINDTTGKYDNKIITINGNTYNFKNYIEAINILINNVNATYNDIPIFINEEHYKKVIEEKGSLTAAEEEKANEYYKALTEYKEVSLINAFNPFGSYRNNILEKEAYKENPSWFINLFMK